jgi:hypothetical protein
VQGMSLSTSSSTVWTCRVYPFPPPAVLYGLQGIPFPPPAVLYGRAGYTLSTSSSTVWTCRVYPCPPPAVWRCTVYSFHCQHMDVARYIPFHRQQYGRAGCIPFHCQQNVCRVYLFYRQKYGRAGCISFNRHQYGRAGYIPFHRQQYRSAGFIPVPSPSLAAWTWRVYVTLFTFVKCLYNYYCCLYGAVHSGFEGGKWAEMALTMLVAISGPKKVSILALLGIHVILVRIQIRRSMPLTNGS